MIQDLEIGFRAARSVPDVADTLGTQKTKFMKFFSRRKKLFVFLQNSKSSDFSHFSASARKAKEGISSFWWFSAMLHFLLENRVLGRQGPAHHPSNWPPERLTYVFWWAFVRAKLDSRPRRHRGRLWRERQVAISAKKPLPGVQKCNIAEIEDPSPENRF